MTPKTAQREDTRERIVRTAIELFHARSFESVGVAEICEAAQINKGSFYHFFASKEALVLAVIDAIWANGQTMFRGVLIDDTDTAPLDRIVGFFGGIERKTREMTLSSGRFPGCPIGNLVAEMSTQSEAVRQRLAEVYEGWADIFAVPLREAINAGDLPADTNAKTMAHSMVVLLQGLSLTTKAHGDGRKMKRIARFMLAQTLGVEI